MAKEFRMTSSCPFKIVAQMPWLHQIMQELHLGTCCNLRRLHLGKSLQKGQTLRKWQENLFGECQDEFFETFGQYDADDLFAEDTDEEDFQDWADRIRQEYVTKQHAEAQRLASSGFHGKRKKEVDEEDRANRALHERLQREHEEYLARAARKEEETHQGKKRRYEERCADTVSTDTAAVATTKLSYRDIPWTAPKGSVEVMLHGADRKDMPVFRKLLRRQQTVWHPDRFAQRCGTRLEEGDKQRILETVTALSQELNRLSPEALSQCQTGKDLMRR
ncbi:NF-kappa-B inhibitor-like protein 1 isoform X1 [Salmo trutta]|uniref:NF-kappa-B inhibitor-like protein 1 isoform X1 n=1 Tax=Salmo trutta TaxID=8032 RepID=UPI00112FEDC0|nr:NF-kappa-B inhibitor-like protein 1 isoform X1 [Salmo trutta]